MIAMANHTFARKMASSTERPSHVDRPSALIIRTGNIINDMKGKTSQTATDELSESLANALQRWQTTDIQNAIPSSGIIECYNEKNGTKISAEERKDIKFTVKILLKDPDPIAVVDALNAVLAELQVSFVESLIVAFPPTPHKLTLLQIQPVWTILEEEKNAGKILSIGISDLDTSLLIELHNWATVKPSVNQVNLATCCVIPPDMVAFAKEHDIQLLTHNDPRDILPDEVAHDVVSKTYLPSDDLQWIPYWIVRYSALVKCRGVIQNKGYIAYFKAKSTS